MTKRRQQITAFAFGVAFVIAMLVLAVWIMAPANFQHNVFKTVLAISIAL